MPVVDDILSKEAEVKKLARNAYYAIYGEEHYYMKFYPALHDTDVTVTINEYRLKNKENKYIHAFEYIVKNNSDADIKVEKVYSERLAGLKDITTSTFVDLDRLDVADTMAVPLAVATGGLSLGFTVANNVRLGMVVKEATRYAHSLPENYDLKANSSMRILCLKFKDDPQPLEFTVNKLGQTYKFAY